MDAIVMFKFPAPVLEIVKFAVVCSPTLTFPKLTDVLLGEIRGCELTPVAVRLMGEEALPPLPTSVTDAVKLPALLGAAAIDTAPLCPAPSVIGRALASTNCGLVKFAALIVTLFVPVFVTVIACACCCPTSTFP